MKYLYIYISIFLLFIACKKDPVENRKVVLTGGSDYTGNDLQLRVHDFIWKGLNTYYLWQAEVPNLLDNRFGGLANTQSGSNDGYTNFLRKYPNNKVGTTQFFHSLLNNYDIVDRFSYITDDYTVLENQFKGITASVGINYVFGIVKEDGKVLAYVRYVVPNSEAARQGLQRGDVILEINGQPLSKENGLRLLQQTPVISFITYRFGDGKFEPTGKSYTLHQTQEPENPVLIQKVFSKGGRKIAYLMYNAFVADFDEALNDAFASFKAQGVTDLILDLRYNGGGSINSATYLASMITGQYSGQVFAREQWNKKLQGLRKNVSTEYFTTQIEKETKLLAINSLNLSKLYVITSKHTASASELVINGLKAYIDVVQIGETTMGKNQGSITLYDYIDSAHKVKNPKHKWAMQPLVLKIENAKGVGDYEKGLRPDIYIREMAGNLGELGDENEPLLARVLQEITGSTSTKRVRRALGEPSSFSFEEINTSTSGYFGLNEMYK